MNQVKKSIKQKMDLSSSTVSKVNDIEIIMKYQRIRKIREDFFSLRD